MNQHSFTNELLEKLVTKKNTFSLTTEHSVRSTFDYIQSSVTKRTDAFMLNADFEGKMNIAGKLAVLAPETINEFITTLAQHMNKPQQFVFDLILTSQNTLRNFLSAVNDLQSPVVQAAGGGLSKEVIIQFLETEIGEVLSKLLFANLYVEYTLKRQLDTKYEVELLFDDMRRYHETSQFVCVEGVLS